MFGRFGWAEILVIVVLVLILFGHNKIPGMMKNLADGINVFKKELKDKSKKGENSPAKAEQAKNATQSSNDVKKVTKKPVKAGRVGVKKQVKRSTSKQVAK